MVLSPSHLNANKELARKFHPKGLIFTVLKSARHNSSPKYMHHFTNACIAMVYEKSELGLLEFNSNKRSLGVRERQVLVLVNGTRNLDDLEKFFKREQLEETLQKLKLEGFIYERSGESVAKASNISLTTLSFFNPETAANPINPAKIAAVKQILIDAADDYLGLMGRPLKDKVSKCANEADLRACVSSWHMAMRESKLGRESTDFLMEQIHQTLENNLLDDNNVAQNTH